MTRTRGISIAIAIAVVAALGGWLHLRTSGSTKKVAATGSAAHATSAPARVKAKPARVIVTVTDAKGPLAGATVRLEDGTGDVSVVLAGRDGVARAETLAPGTWQVSASAEGHEPGAASARELHEGETVNIDLKLALGGRVLTGVVTDVTGGPIGGARIDAAKLGAAARPSDAVATTLTGADGKYKLTVAEGQQL